MFEEWEDKLMKRAAYIEGLEGTVKQEYTTQISDVKNVNSFAIKRAFVLIIILCVFSVVCIVYGFISKESFIVGIASGFFVVLLFVSVFFGALEHKTKRNMANVRIDEVKLAFNLYGMVMRVCNDIRSAVYAYKWNDFDSMTENDRAIVGIKDGLAFIIPKRVVTEEDFEKLRRFSYAALGNKCIYKGFKGN